jgi:hypothetical protein
MPASHSGLFRVTSCALRRGDIPEGWRPGIWSLARNSGRLAPQAANPAASLCSANFQYPKLAARASRDRLRIRGDRFEGSPCGGHGRHRVARPRHAAAVERARRGDGHGLGLCPHCKPALCPRSSLPKRRGLRESGARRAGRAFQKWECPRARSAPKSNPSLLFPPC